MVNIVEEDAQGWLGSGVPELKVATEDRRGDLAQKSGAGRESLIDSLGGCEGEWAQNLDSSLDPINTHKVLYLI